MKLKTEIFCFANHSHSFILLQIAFYARNKLSPCLTFPFWCVRVRAYFLLVPIALSLSLSYSLWLDVITVDSFIRAMNEWRVFCDSLFDTTSTATPLHSPQCTTLAVRRLQFNLRFVAFAPYVYNLIPYSVFIVIILLFTFHFFYLFILFCFFFLHYVARAFLHQCSIWATVMRCNQHMHSFDWAQSL